MYNLRYHIASLVAVFLALAVGLVLGTVVAERGMLTSQSSALVDDLQRRFEEMNATNTELRVGRERDRAFAEALEPAVVGDALAALDVTMLVGTGRVDGLAAATAGVEGAGAATSLVSIETAGLGLETAAPDGLEQYFSDRGETMQPPGASLRTQVARALVGEWAEPAERPLTALLVGEGLLGVDSMAETSTVDAIVVMAASDGGCDPFALAVAEAARSSGGRAVGAESLSSDNGVARACADAGISAVDHVSTPQGRFSLVWVLAGRAEGYFGFGKGADAPYPRVE